MSKYSAVNLGGNAVYSVNDSGEAVGNGKYGKFAVEWSPTGAVTKLGYGSAHIINDSGDIAGFTDANGQQGNDENYVVWSSDGVIATTLLAPAGTLGVAGISAMDSVGDTAGSSSYIGDPDVQQQATYWDTSGNGTLLSMPSGDQFSTANAMNDLGDIGGYATLNNNTPLNDQAVMWSNSGSILWEGDVGSQITHINESGTSIGYDDEGHLAAMWSSNGVETLLQNPVTSTHPLYGTAVNAINDAGISVGSVEQDSKRTPTNGNPFEAIRWSDTGVATILAHKADAISINDNGYVVGYTYNDTGVPTAALWSPTGKKTNLQNVLGEGWLDTVPKEINNAGDIIGTGEYNNISESFLLVPTATGSYISVDHYAHPEAHTVLSASTHP